MIKSTSYHSSCKSIQLLKQDQNRIILENLVYFLLCWISIFLAANRFWLNTFDTENYLLEFRSYNQFDFETNFFEPGFSFVMSFAKLLGGDEGLFLFIVACIGVGLKFLAIKKYNRYIYLAVIVYYSKYYLMHEMIQVRVGIAAGLFLLSVEHIEKRNILQFSKFAFMSFLFHYSSLICLFAYVVCSKKITNRQFVLWSLLTILVVLTFSIDNKILEFLKLDIDKVQGFMDATIKGDFDDFKLFNITNVMRLMVLAALYFKQDRIKKHVEHFDVWFRIYALSLVFFVVFRSVPVFAVRLSEFFDVVMIVVFPMLVYISKSKFIGYALLTTLVAATFYNYYIKQSIIFQ